MYKVIRKTSTRHYMLSNTSDKLDTNYHYYSDTGNCHSNRLKPDEELPEAEVQKIKQAVEKYNKDNNL